MFPTHRRTFLGGLFGTAAAAGLSAGEPVTARQQPQPRAADPSQEAERIVNQEIVPAITVAIRAAGKRPTADAFAVWAPKLRDAVAKRLAEGRDWSKSRDTVLAVASGMGNIAAILSYTEPDVTQARIHAAFSAVDAHAACPKVRTRGAWCDFGI